MNQQILFGKISKLLYKPLDQFSFKKIFLVTGKSSFSSSGAKNVIIPLLKNKEVTHFYDFEINPKLTDIKKGIELFKSNNCEIIIGVGGGTVIDMAKSIAILTTQNRDSEEYIKQQGKLTKRKIPLIIIPTTAGTGSESTHFSVVYIDKVKYSLAHNSMLPDYALLDSSLTENLPPYITACTGMDALCQAIESFWSVLSTKESRVLSKKAIAFIIKNISDAVNRPTKKSRRCMLEGSNLAGQAINISKTTAAHAVSYPLTSYHNIPHGHAVSLTLSYFIEFNYNVDEKSIQDKRGVSFVKNIMKELLATLEVSSAEDARKKFIQLMKEIHLKQKLFDFGIKNHQIILEQGFNPERVILNPRQVSRKDLNTILDKIA